jgi:Sulfotransferase family
MDPRHLARLVRRRLRRRVLEPFEHRVRAPLRRLQNHGLSYRPIFVAGASGSGTSLLAVSLAQRFQTAGVVYEMDTWIAPTSDLYVRSLDEVRSVHEYERMILPADGWSLPRCRRDLLALFQSYATERAQAIVAKGPDINLVRAGLLTRCFPDAQHVLIFRDPVANLEGWRRKWRAFGDDSLDECMRLYVDMHDRFLKETAELPDRVSFVCYEDLVEDPETTLDDLGAALGLVRRAGSVRLHGLAERDNVEGKGLRNVHGNRIGVVRDANARAYSRLSLEEVERIQLELEPLHERLQSLAATGKPSPRLAGSATV